MLRPRGPGPHHGFRPGFVEGGVDLTRPQTVLGTPAYMSPEQVRGEKTDGRTDIWSFGCTLFEMTTGRRPFAGERAEDVRDEDPERRSRRSLLSQGRDPGGTRGGHPQVPPEKAGGTLSGFREPHVGPPEARASGRRKRQGERRRSPEALPSVAVLPFADMSPAKDQDYFGEGLAEELIHALARIQGIRVVARTSAFALKGMKLDVREIGKMLGVGAVLEGSVRKAGNRLRVTAQLIDAATGLHLWSERFDREERDVFDIQDEISLAIVEHLKVTLLAGEKTALRKRSTADTEAYNLYLKGLYFVARPNPESYAKALDFFQDSPRPGPGLRPGLCGRRLRLRRPGHHEPGATDRDVPEGQGGPARRRWPWTRPGRGPRRRGHDRVLVRVGLGGRREELRPVLWRSIRATRCAMACMAGCCLPGGGSTRPSGDQAGAGARPADAPLLCLVHRHSCGPRPRNDEALAEFAKAPADRPEFRPGLFPRRRWPTI